MERCHPIQEAGQIRPQVHRPVAMMWPMDSHDVVRFRSATVLSWHYHDVAKEGYNVEMSCMLVV